MESAKLISAIKPDYVGFLTLMLDESTEIYRQIQAGEMELLTPEEVVEEMRLFLTNVDSQGDGVPRQSRIQLRDPEGKSQRGY